MHFKDRMFSLANEEEIFNPDCPVRILLEDVKTRCNCNDKGKANSDHSVPSHPCVIL